MDAFEQPLGRSAGAGPVDSVTTVLAAYGSRYAPFLAAYVTLVMALGIDLFLLVDIPFLEEGPPLLGGVFLIRTVFIGATGGLLVWGVVRVGERSQGPENSVTQPQLNLPPAFWKGAIWLAWLLSAIFLTIFLISPRLFHWLSWEDRPVEAASAALYFISAGLFIMVIRRALAARENHYRFYMIIAAIFVLGFVFAGLEEISWMQRIFGLDTPSILENSPRDELNFHNLATDLFENIFYFQFFLFAVVAPFFNHRTNRLERISVLRPFVPPAILIFVAAMVMAFNYDMWNVFFIQLSFFTTLAVLIYYGSRDRQIYPISAYPVLVIFFSLVLFQILFLFYGDRSPRPWDVTEYKEFLIPLTLAVYALVVFRRFQSVNRKEDE